MNQALVVLELREGGGRSESPVCADGELREVSV